MSVVESAPDIEVAVDRDGITEISQPNEVIYCGIDAGDISELSDDEKVTTRKRSSLDASLSQEELRRVKFTLAKIEKQLNSFEKKVAYISKLCAHLVTDGVTPNTQKDT